MKASPAANDELAALLQLDASFLGEFYGFLHQLKCHKESYIHLTGFQKFPNAEVTPLNPEAA